MIEKEKIIDLIKDLFSNEQERKQFLCYLLLTKNDKEFNVCKKIT